jgi:hypothetical protein
MKSVRRGTEAEPGVFEKDAIEAGKRCNTSGTEVVADFTVVARRKWIAPSLESLGKMEEMTLGQVGGSLKPL